ncbi:hypothetical protein FOZ63_004526, partial [Perkinsus olseni]
YEDQVIHNAVEEHKQMQAFKNRAAANIAASSRHERDQQAFQLPTFMKDIQDAMIDNLTWQGYREDDVMMTALYSFPLRVMMKMLGVRELLVDHSKLNSVVSRHDAQAPLKPRWFYCSPCWVCCSDRIRRSHALGGQQQQQQQQQQPSDTHLLLSASYNTEDRLREMREAIGEHPSSSPPPGTVAVREDIHKKKKGNRRSSLTMGNRLSSFRTPHKKIDEFGRYLPNADDDDEGDTIDPNNIYLSTAVLNAVVMRYPVTHTVVMVINKAPPPPPPSPAMPTSPGVPAWTNGGYNHRPLDNAGYSTSSTLVVPSCIYGHAIVNDNYVKRAEGRLWRRDLPWESSGWAHDSTTRAMMLFNNTDIRPYTSPSLATLYQLDM